MRDIATLVLKEWREIFYQRGSLLRGITTNLLLPVIVLGVAMPLLAGKAWVGIGGTLLYVWMPPYLTLGVVADSFAGERERHTLEALLCTRLPDTAILAGKMLAAISFGLIVTVLVAVLGLTVVNIGFSEGGFLFFAPEAFAVIVVGSLLLTSLVANVGVLVSMTAASVRQAAQKLSIIVVVPGLIITGASQLVPMSTLESVIDAAVRHPVIAFVLLLGSLVSLDAGLFAACKVRFKREKLILG